MQVPSFDFRACSAVHLAGLCASQKRTHATPHATVLSSSVFVEVNKGALPTSPDMTMTPCSPQSVPTLPVAPACPTKQQPRRDISTGQRYSQVACASGMPALTSSCAPLPPVCCSRAPMQVPDVAADHTGSSSGVAPHHAHLGVGEQHCRLLSATAAAAAATAAGAGGTGVSSVESVEGQVFWCAGLNQHQEQHATV